MHTSSLGSLTVLLTSFAALVSACGSVSVQTDSGSDAQILLPDVGPLAVDAASPVDAGPPDSGDGLCADLTGLPFGTPPLPATCLPRCTTETQAAVAACGADTACASAAFDADTTAPAMFRTMYGIFTVACGAHRTYPCLLWQSYSCYEQYCRSEFYAYSDCVDGGGTCETEFEPVQACIDADPDAMTCLHDRIAGCFP